MRCETMNFYRPTHVCFTSLVVSLFLNYICIYMHGAPADYNNMFPCAHYSYVISCPVCKLNNTNVVGGKLQQSLLVPL
jgi:hypothetical protein